MVASIALALSAPTLAQDIHAVACVQKQMNHLGFDAGSVDGLIGAKTRAAADAYIAYMKGGPGGEGWAQPRLNASNAAHWCEKVGEAHPQTAKYWREYRSM
jgi:hypothetical protein